MNRPWDFSCLTKAYHGEISLVFDKLCFAGKFQQKMTNSRPVSIRNTNYKLYYKMLSHNFFRQKTLFNIFIRQIFQNTFLPQWNQYLLFLMCSLWFLQQRGIFVIFFSWEMMSLFIMLSRFWVQEIKFAGKGEYFVFSSFKFYFSYVNKME